MLRVVQCWDDGVTDDIGLTEILRRHGAKASFNLNPETHRAERHGGMHPRLNKLVERLARDELRGVYEGFTIANHAMTHPWATRIPLEQWRAEVADARAWLQDWFGQPVDGFAYPFGDCDAATAQVVREAGHVYGRGTKSATPCWPAEDVMRLAPDCHFLAPDFWERYERAKASPARVFYFWGHSFELVTEADWRNFDARMARIAADADAEWAELPAVFR